jgi:uncharacterized protein
MSGLAGDGLVAAGNAGRSTDRDRLRSRFSGGESVVDWGVSPRCRTGPDYLQSLRNEAEEEQRMAFDLTVLREKREHILQVAARRGAHNVRVFGSVARGEADATSDIDFLVDMEPGRSLLDLGGLLVDLEALLGQRVDVVTEKGLRPRVRQQALREAVPL